MKSIFENKILNREDIIIELSIPSGALNDNGVYVEYHGIALVDKFKTVKEAEEKLPSLVDYYNNELWKDYILLSLMVRYIHHLKLYNEKGWERRLDFTTPELYEAFIRGIETVIRGYILEKLNLRFTSTHLTSNIVDSVMFRNEKLSDE